MGEYSLLNERMSSSWKYFAILTKPQALESNLNQSVIYEARLNSELEKGIALRQQGDYDAAVSVIQNAHLEADQLPEMHRQLGLIYGFTGMFDESIDELVKASSLSPERNDIRNELALTYSMLGMNDEAKAEFEEVLRRDPADEKALANIVFFQDC